MKESSQESVMLCEERPHLAIRESEMSGDEIEDV
mgnify:CR=1 FL=1